MVGWGASRASEVDGCIKGRQCGKVWLYLKFPEMIISTLLTKDKHREPSVWVSEVSGCM